MTKCLCLSLQVFQRRVNGMESFYRDWNTYKAGFGPLRGDHWLGNDNLHAITSTKDYQLRVDIVDSVNSSFYALYNLFSVSNETDNYRLLLGSYNGTAGLCITFSSIMYTWVIF